MYTRWSSVHWKATGVPLVDPVYTGIPLDDPANIAGYTATPLEKKTYLKLPHTGMPLEELWLLQPTLEHRWKDYNSTHQAHMVTQSSIHASLKWQDDETLNSKCTGLCKFSFYLTFTALQCISVLLVKCVSTSTSLCACLGYEHHYSFCVFGAAVQWNQLCSNNSLYTRCLHRGLHAGKWPDLMTSKSDAPGTLRYHWPDCTGTTLADAIAQWFSRGSPVLICIIGTH